MPDVIAQLSHMAQTLREGRPLAEAAHAGKKMVFGTWRDVKNGGKEATTEKEHGEAAAWHKGEAAKHKAKLKAALDAGETRFVDAHARHAAAHTAAASRHQHPEFYASEVAGGVAENPQSWRYKESASIARARHRSNLDL